MDIGKDIVAAIDKHFVDYQGDGMRTHLGASVLGRKCPREVWYHWRWFRPSRHIGRMLRLFQRGHDEEIRIVTWLRSIGAVVQDTDPETGKQFRIADFGEHLGGSGDSRIGNLERFGLNGWGLLEMKTASDKYFKQMAASGVISNKPEHYTQMQIYMGYMELPWALYVCINKNDDSLYMEVILFREEVFRMNVDKAYAIITSRQPPPRISEDSSWFACKFCDCREICHYGQPAAKNCRSCVNANPDTEEGGWYCMHWKAKIPANAIKDGCDKWEQLPG